MENRPTPATPNILPRSLVDNGDLDWSQAPSVAELRQAIGAEVVALMGWVEDAARVGFSFTRFEMALVPQIFRIARLVIMMFLATVEVQVAATVPPRIEHGRRVLRRRPPQARNLNTFFGVVRYARIYMRGDDGHGYHPLDAALGLTADRISIYLLSLAVRLATKLSFAETHTMLGCFVPAPPSTEVIEQTVLGFGACTREWAAFAPPPEGDGEVLVLQFDGKAAPTATAREMERRRGKRRPNTFPGSRRHRGRARRARYGSKPRRKKGDKSKNGKVATLAVMYTLRRQGSALLGPINQRVYGSFESKRHVFEVARRDADKRGFGEGSGKLIQVVTDGDEDLARCVKEYFPEAVHTIDVMHALEYVWKAGRCLHREGSKALKAWAEAQKRRLLGGKAQEIVDELRQAFGKIPATGPGNKGRRARLSQATEYLAKRVDRMNYKKLRRMDLEIASGAVEGAIKHTIGKRFDHGGMRWIRERAEALLQLRCIEINGDWDAFIDFVHDGLGQVAREEHCRLMLQRKSPLPLHEARSAA